MSTTTLPAARTFRGPAGSGLPNLAGLAGVHRTEAEPAAETSTERHDTDDRRLAAAGLRLARDHDGVWTLDAPGAPTLRVPAAEDPHAGPPSGIGELVHAAARERAVRPAVQLRTVSTRTRLLDGESVLAVIVHDAVTLATLGRSTDVESWDEITLEPGAGGSALLDALTDRVEELGLRPARPDADAALDRHLRPGRRLGPVGPKRSSGARLMRYLAAQAERLAAADLDVRRAEPGAIHRMRVAARRLRSALRAYRPLLDGDRTDPVAAGLRDLGRALAPARDAEVLRERIDAELATLPPELVIGPVRAEATRHFARTEAEARAGALTALDGDGYARLRQGLDALLADPPLTGRAARRTLDVGPAGRRLRRAMDRALTSGEDRDLHAARKAAKRLRYATEVAGAKPKRLKALQRALGTHQDAVVARPTLRELGATAENGFTFGLLLGRAEARAEAVQTALPGLWKRAR